MPSNPWTYHIAARMEALMVESESITATFCHNGLRGTIREVFVKQFLEPFLPPQIGIGTGEIINHEGMRSKQLDVILYNKERVPPILLTGSDIGIFPWECVVSVIEVKSKLNTGALQEAHVNANSVKEVYSNLKEKDILINGLRPLWNMFAFGPIPYYVFAFNSDLVASNETQKIECGNSEFCIGNEGSRLFKSLDALLERRQPYEVVLSKEDSPKEDRENAIKQLSNMGGVSIFLHGGNIHGVCVASTEWTQGHMQFESKVFEQYSSEPIRIARNWNYCWQSYFNKGAMENVLNFLAHIIELSYEMPRCREHYNISRYLSG